MRPPPDGSGSRPISLYQSDKEVGAWRPECNAAQSESRQPNSALRGQLLAYGANYDPCVSNALSGRVQKHHTKPRAIGLAKPLDASHIIIVYESSYAVSFATMLLNGRSSSAP